MTHDVRQWLTEIKTLQQKLAEAQQERDEAFASAANWRQLYETEARQRRTEANLARQQTEALQVEIERLKQGPANANASKTVQASLHVHLASIEDPAQLKDMLAKALLECDRLSQALRSEQAKHAQTRKSLTTALGDTVDMLTKERLGQSIEPSSTAIVSSRASSSDLNPTSTNPHTN